MKEGTWGTVGIIIPGVFNKHLVSGEDGSAEIHMIILEVLPT